MRQKGQARSAFKASLVAYIETTAERRKSDDRENRWWRYNNRCARALQELAREVAKIPDEDEVFQEIAALLPEGDDLPGTDMLNALIDPPGVQPNSDDIPVPNADSLLEDLLYRLRHEEARNE